jgi:hypothetical protein
MRQTAIENELSALNIRYQGQLTAHGSQVYASEASTAADIYKSNAQNDLTSGYLGAGAALLSSGSNYITGGFGPTPWPRFYAQYQGGARPGFGAP